MYLSKLVLDVTAPSVRQSLRDCQDMHRSIMRAFDLPREEAGVLYYVAQTKSSIAVYVQSGVMPDWSRIEAKGYRCEQMRDISAITDRFTAGEVLHFRLLACPSKKIVVPGEKNSHRVYLRTPAQRVAWLEKQGEKYGFRLLSVMEQVEDVKKSGTRNQQPIYITGTQFNGMLQITDEEKFCSAYKHGIGAEKAYGMGLMMVTKG